MKIILKTLTISFFLFYTIYVSGQGNNSSNEEENISEENEYDKFRNDSLSHINDSFLNVIDSLLNNINLRKKPSKKKIKITAELDTLIGEQITKIEKQTYKNQCKYSFTTNKLIGNMSVKIIDFYFYNDALIKVNLIYDLTNKNKIDNYYFKNNDWFFGRFAHGMCIGICMECNENKAKEFLEIGNIIIKGKR